MTGREPIANAAPAGGPSAVVPDAGPARAAAPRSGHQLPDVLDRRFVVVSGKGGVGKSTLAAAIGWAAASCGRRTCIVQLNTRDAMGPIFLGRDAVGYEPVRLDPRLPLWSVDLRPEPALREYGLMKLRFAALHKLVFENEVMRRLLRMVPGMTETLLLGKAWFMEAAEQDASGRRRWDVLVVDAPSTGHGISLLRLPETLLKVISVGPMADDARQMQALLVDPTRTALHIATLPAELPVNEALDLAGEAIGSIGLPSGWMIANQVLPGLADGADCEALVAAVATSDDALLRHSLDNAQAMLRWREQQQTQLRRLRQASPLPVVEVPHQLGPIHVAAVRALAEQLCEAPSAQLAGGALARGVVGVSAPAASSP